MAGTLYLVGTPIGNLGDMTDRARAVLAAVDLVAAEDTRRTAKLLSRFGIRAPLVSFFEANEARRTNELLEALRSGRDVGVVSDAGMPGLSDPGYRLVRACIEDGIDVSVVPGPSAAVAALVISGLPTDRFAFEGFLPRKPGERRTRLAALAADPRTIVAFESPRRLRALLQDARSVLGDRRVAVVRELTKVHEEVRRGRVSEVLEGLEEVRGEVVVVIEGAREPRTPDLDAAVREARALTAEGMRKRAAAARAATRHGVPVNRLYRALLGPEASGD